MGWLAKHKEQKTIGTDMSEDTPPRGRKRDAIGTAKTAADTAKTIVEGTSNAVNMIKWVAIAIIGLVILGGSYLIYSLMAAPVKAVGNASKVVTDSVKSGAVSMKDNTSEVLNRLIIPTSDQTLLETASEAAFEVLTQRASIEPNGLKENLPKGLELLEHLWDNAKADTDAYNKYVEKIYKGRQDGKTQKGNILFGGLMNYGKYGENSRLRDIMQIDELKVINPEDLVALVKDMKNYKQRVFYYGKDVENAVSALNTNHKLYGDLKEYPVAKKI